MTIARIDQGEDEKTSLVRIVSVNLFDVYFDLLTSVSGTGEDLNFAV